MVIQSTKNSLTDGEGENRIAPNPKNIFFAKCKKVCNKGCGVLKQDNANEKRNKSLCERFRGSARIQAHRERKNECEQFSGHP